MKITRCKYGHYYDKAYFSECPHCCRQRGGRDEDIIIKNTHQSEDLSDTNLNRVSDESQNVIQNKKNIQREKDKANVERWIGEAWDELEEILSEGEKKEETQKDYREEKKEDSKKDIKKDKEAEKNNRMSENYMLFVAMPLKVIKNQEFCIDFCLYPEEEWETGAKMLHFKSQESIRDLKPVQIALPAKALLRIMYKDEEIFQKDINLCPGTKKKFCTFPVTVTDTRDRRFHMIKAVFEIKEQNIEVPLYLVPNP